MLIPLFRECVRIPAVFRITKCLKQHCSPARLWSPSHSCWSIRCCSSLSRAPAAGASPPLQHLVSAWRSSPSARQTHESGYETSTFTSCHSDNITNLKTLSTPLNLQRVSGMFNKKIRSFISVSNITEARQHHIPESIGPVQAVFSSKKTLYDNWINHLLASQLQINDNVNL